MTSLRLLIAIVVLAAATVSGQEQRLPSPAGHSAVQIGNGTYDVQYGHIGGKWIDVFYGRPIKRGRDLFGPSDWAEMLNAAADVSRARANQSTSL